MMTERLTINKTENELEITIKSLKIPSKQNILLLWIVLFSLCGLAIATQFFFGYDKSTNLFFAVYLAFWFFFEFKVIYAYRWRRAGREIIKINSTTIEIIKEIGKRGISQNINPNEVKKIIMFEPEESGFIKAMNSSYWHINKYKLAFEYNGKPIPFGIDLEKHDAKKLQKEIQQFITKIKSI